MKHCYLFSGLGVDERVFQYLNLPAVHVHYIEWIKPEGSESIESYGKRLLAQIGTDYPILIGLSFGGMMAVEVAKLIKTEKVILISSAKTKADIPGYFKFTGLLKLHKLVPAWLMKTPNFFSYWLFGVKSKGDKHLLAAILKDTDTTFLKWAVDKIANWQNITAPSNVIHIHGSADKLLPIRFVVPDEIVGDGGHFMVVDKAAQVSEAISRYLN